MTNGRYSRDVIKFNVKFPSVEIDLYPNPNVLAGHFAEFD